MNNFLYISNDYSFQKFGGRQNLSLLLQKVFKKIIKKKLFIYKLKKVSNTGFVNSIINMFESNIDGINQTTKKKLIKIIEEKKIKYIFIEGSNLGGLCKYLKLYNSKIKIVVFFHNVESKFFFDNFKIKKTIHSLGVLIANYIAEKKSCDYSDKSITLTKDDKNLVYRIYGKKVNYITPLFKEDLRQNQNTEIIKNKKNFILFVGSAFYANIKGIEWFVDKVLPNINYDLAVIGNNFEKFHNLLNNKKIIFLGKVNNIDKWYKNASFVISPIFLGSGMKSKIVEAMMYGKKILGTKFSFIGYEKVKSKIGIECNDKYSFIKEINKMEKNKKKYFFHIRKLYEINYSFEASINIFSKIIKKI